MEALKNLSGTTAQFSSERPYFLYPQPESLIHRMRMLEQKMDRLYAANSWHYLEQTRLELGELMEDALPLPPGVDETALLLELRPYALQKQIPDQPLHSLAHLLSLSHY